MLSSCGRDHSGRDVFTAIIDSGLSCSCRHHWVFLQENFDRFVFEFLFNLYSYELSIKSECLVNNNNVALFPLIA